MNEPVRITWLGHSCFRMEYRGWALVTDPYADGMVPGLPPLRTAAGAVYCSHEHDDHNARTCVRITRQAPPPDFAVEAEIHPDRSVAGDAIIARDLRERGDGIEATRLIKAMLPAVKVVMLTVSQDDANLFEAVKAGAAGYLLKGLSKEHFLKQLSGLAAGEAPLSPGLAAKILAEFARREREREAEAAAAAKAQLLTPRHAEILRHLVNGLTYKEIGEKLGISESAVKYHMGEITARLQLDNKFQVIAFAGKLGLAPAAEK